MSPLSVALLALSLTAPAPKGAAVTDDSPQWRGPNRDGHSPSTGLLKTWPADGPKLLWKSDKLGAGYSCPAVAGDKLVVLGAEDAKEGTKEFALCLNPADGKQVWRTPIETASGKYLYQWGSGPRGTPTIDGDFVYVLGAKGDLLCLKLADGSKVWDKNLVADLGGGVPQWGYSESVLIDGDRLICTPGGAKGAIASLDKKTGDVRWRSTDLKDPAAYASPVITDAGGVKQYVTQTMQSVCSVRADDGKLLWRKTDLSYRIAVIPTPVVYQDHVFVTSGYGAGCELLKLSKDGDGVKADKVYTSKVIANHHGGVVRVGEHVYGHSDTGGQWVCLPFLKSKDGEEPKPEWTSKKLEKGSITYADGLLFCYGERTGDLVAIEASPKDWKEIGRLKLPEKSKLERRMGQIWPHPVVAHGKLWLRDHEMLFCFDLTGKN